MLLALIAAAYAGPLIDIEDDGTYHMKAQKIEDQSFYDEILDNNDFDSTITNAFNAAPGQFP